jgi:hypothetical protein
MNKIESKPLPAPGARPITENDRQWLDDAIKPVKQWVVPPPIRGRR